MFDLSSEFKRFYRECVVLPETKQAELRAGRKKNIKRFKFGLVEYNKLNQTDYEISETLTQGSMAMHTTVQDINNDYDIDVALVMDSKDIADISPLTLRRMVGESWNKKSGNMNIPAEVKTGCVRVRYSKGYHLDFSVFRENRRQYEHAGKEWTERDIRAVTKWYNTCNKARGYELGKIVRLSKMFCKSRSQWQMPTGIIQTVLCQECFKPDKRLDKSFLDTMIAIQNRLTNNKQVSIPVDGGRSLIYRVSDLIRVTNLQKRLSENLCKVQAVLNAETCTAEQAIRAWGEFFNYSNFWNVNHLGRSINESAIGIEFDQTEQFIDELYPIDEQIYPKITCSINKAGYRATYPEERLSCGCPLPIGLKIIFEIHNVFCSYDQVLWKVRNVGSEAERRNDIRGQIQNRSPWIEETTLFTGPHYIECYVIKDGICIGIGHKDVPIC